MVFKKFVPLLAVTTLFMSMFVGSANAETGSLEENDNDVISHLFLQEDNQDWTAERMQNAQPLEQTIDNPDTGLQKDNVAEPNSQTALEAEENPWVDPKTVGKLFFSTIDRNGQPVDRFCSASTINGGRNNLALTAAGCVYSYGADNRDLRHYSTNMRYVPGYNNGQAPYGQWSIASGLVSRDWVANQKRLDDNAILVVAPLNGANIVDRFSGNDLRTDVIVSDMRNAGKIQVLGYPISYNDQPNGQLRSCSTDDLSVSSNTNDYVQYNLRCKLAGSTQFGNTYITGSPWLVNENGNVRVYATNASSRYSAGGYNLGTGNGNSLTKLFTEAKNTSFVNQSILGAEIFVGTEGILPPNTRIVQDVTNPRIYYVTGAVQGSGVWNFTLITRDNRGVFLEHLLGFKFRHWFNFLLSSLKPY